MKKLIILLLLVLQLAFQCDAPPYYKNYEITLASGEVIILQDTHCQTKPNGGDIFVLCWKRDNKDERAMVAKELRVIE